MAMTYERALAAMMAMNDIDRGVGVTKSGRGVDVSKALSKYGVTQAEVNEFRAGLEEFGKTNAPVSGAVPSPSGGDSFYLPRKGGGIAPIQSLPSPIEYLQTAYKQSGASTPVPMPNGNGGRVTSGAGVNVPLSDTLRDPSLASQPFAGKPSPSVPSPWTVRPMGDISGTTRGVEINNPNDPNSPVKDMPYNARREGMVNTWEGANTGTLPVGGIRINTGDGKVRVGQSSGMNDNGVYPQNPAFGTRIQPLGATDRVAGTTDDPVLYYLNGTPITRSQHEARQPALDMGDVWGASDPLATGLQKPMTTQEKAAYAAQLERMRASGVANEAQAERASREKIAGIEAHGNNVTKQEKPPVVENPSQMAKAKSWIRQTSIYAQNQIKALQSTIDPATSKLDPTKESDAKLIQDTQAAIDTLQSKDFQDWQTDFYTALSENKTAENNFTSELKKRKTEAEKITYILGVYHNMNKTPDGF